LPPRPIEAGIALWKSATPPRASHGITKSPEEILNGGRPAGSQDGAQECAE